jgi:hypothetical protein
MYIGKSENRKNQKTRFSRKCTFDENDMVMKKNKNNKYHKLRNMKFSSKSNKKNIGKSENLEIQTRVFQ